MEEESIPSELYNYRTYAENVGLLVAGTVSSTLSLYGSLSILYVVLRQRSSLKDIYHRILLGLSFTDTITSTTSLLQPFAVNKETNLPFAFGNQRTCETAGFLIQFLIGSYLYSAELCLYFLLTIKYSKTSAELARWLEPYIHILPFLAPLAVSSTALALDILNPTLLLSSCSIGQYPLGCVPESEEECRGTLVDSYGVRWTQAALSIVAACVGIFCMFKIYLTVRNQTKRNLRYTVNGVMTDHQRRQNKTVYLQAMIFSVGFLKGALLMTASAVIEAVYLASYKSPSFITSNKGWYALALLTWLLFPCQGLVNWVVYILPRIRGWREVRPEKSLFSIYREVYKGTTIPRSRISAGVVARRTQQNHQQQHGVDEGNQCEITRIVDPRERPTVLDRQGSDSPEQCGNFTQKGSSNGS